MKRVAVIVGAALAIAVGFVLTLRGIELLADIIHGAWGWEVFSAKMAVAFGLFIGAWVVGMIATFGKVRA